MAISNSDKDLSTQEKLEQKKKLDLVIRSPLPGNRPIVPTNKDADIDEFIGYMD
jgi:hypothetical protein